MEALFSDIFMLGVYGYAAVRGALMMYRKRGKIVKVAEGSALSLDLGSLCVSGAANVKKVLLMDVREIAAIEVW